MRTIMLLIDGYNLLFQSQIVGKSRGPGWLDKARRRLLVVLCNGLTSAEQQTTTIIFDASQTGETAADFLFGNMLEVRFAHAYAEADDMLEELIRQNPHPKQLRVVSSDQRIRRCARARRAESIDSESFLRQLERVPVEQGPTSPHATPEGACDGTDPKDVPPLSSSEVAYWLNEFSQPSSQDDSTREN
jgi:uncharacterized protein